MVLGDGNQLETDYWLQVDRRCWEATYEPSTWKSAHLSEAKDDDGKPWPEWMGEQHFDHPDNEARERAWKRLERDSFPGHNLDVHPHLFDGDGVRIKEQRVATGPET
jgi:hypothetical protein